MNCKIGLVPDTSRKQVTLSQMPGYAFVPLADVKNVNTRGTNGGLGLARIQIARRRIECILG